MRTLTFHKACEMRKKAQDPGPPKLNFEYMKKVVGAPALRLVKVRPDGMIKGFVLTRHMDAILKAYKRDTGKYEFHFDMKEVGVGYSETTYFELYP